VLAVDFGGGTFDVAVIEFGVETAEVTALQGAIIGGEMIDAVIFRTKVADALGLHATFAGQSGAALAMPAGMQRRFQSLAGIKHLVMDTGVGVWLREHAAMPGGAPLGQLNELLYGGQAYAFYRTIEQAKINLSSMLTTPISFHRQGIDVEVDFSRTDLDAIVAPFLVRTNECIDRAMSQAQITDNELSYVVTTGGSSQLSSFQAALTSRFGETKVKVRDPYNTVVTGLGYDAQSRWAE
jgi:molecular chaperone DnaK (HSP70)